MMNTFLAITRLKWLLRSSHSVVLNRLDEPDAMAPPAPSETLDQGLKHVFGHPLRERFGSSRSVLPNRDDEIYHFGHVSGRISAYMAFWKVSFGDSESYRYDLSFGTRFGTIHLNNQKWKYWMAMECLFFFAIVAGLRILWIVLLSPER